MRKTITTMMLVALTSVLAAQNMTDLAVMNDRSAGNRVLQSEVSTVDNSVFLHPNRIRFDDRCLQIEGKDVFVLSGTFHYFRTPQPLWRDRLQKLKTGGFNCVETYVPWNWHERQMPASPDDYSKLDMQPLDDFLRMCEDVGLYVIIRPGPYICAEWSGGGFPQWLMQKRPEKTRYEVWLQSNDPVFMQWNEHWYKAVCKVVTKHQIQKRPKGKTGVILFQVENEFNRIKWFPKEAKKDYLEKLTTIARHERIEIPIITCWTSEARNVDKGVLNGVVDMVNSYPRWQIEKGFGRLINQQLKSQPGKPLISGELQGGWYSDIGGRLSKDLDGVAPVQTQNILLYALQRGFGAVNFYMAAGGTNFDDWAARGVTTTYDCYAAIGEDGTTNERYDRIRALAPMLKEHGTRIAHACESYPQYETTDTLVLLALRQTADGNRYYFVRTEDHEHAHKGIIHTDGLTIDFDLEPFGSMIYYVKKGQQQGEWLTKPFVAVKHDDRKVVITPTRHRIVADVLPYAWKALSGGETVDGQGIYGRHPIYYKVRAKGGSLIQVARVGKNVMNRSDADEITATANGRWLTAERQDSEYIYFRVPANGGREVDVVMLYEDKGLHHHTNLQVEQHWGVGTYSVKVDGEELPISYAYTEADRGIRLSKDGTDTLIGTVSKLLQWHIYTLPAQRHDGKARYVQLEGIGNGFVYLNGHAIGRNWLVGPQRDYYLPECWLRTDRDNYVVVSEHPQRQYPSLCVADGDYEAVRTKIVSEPWAQTSYRNIKQRIDQIAAYQQRDPMWLASRLAMYWKDGERYTQCWLKKEHWERGEGNAPVPTVRMPGMRTWNRYVNVPLEQRTPYNETGDMLGISRLDNTAGVVTVPYKESGHMVNQNNTEILELAEKAAFLYWMEGDERYGQLAASVFNTWLVGTYYMNPILDPEQSLKGPGGYAPGGICGYYDYEQIHDWLGMHAALCYDMAHDYIVAHPHPHLATIGKTTDEVFDVVMKRFIDIGMVRGGKVGNWNVNGWDVMMAPILMLKDNEAYTDGHGQSYYLKYFLHESTEYHNALPDILAQYDKVTGLWPESPGYSFGTVGTLSNFANMLKRKGIDIVKDNPMLQKAALAMTQWIDPRGNFIVFGDYRGGPANYSILENLLTYYSNVGNTTGMRLTNSLLLKGISTGAHRRDEASWTSLCGYVPLQTGTSCDSSNTSYSPFHRVLTMKNDQAGMEAVLYGGRKGSHLSPNGLALQLYGMGYALMPDAAGYESYWSDDYQYHQSATGTNTILPGYTEGDITVNAMSASLLDVSAAEKRRIVKMVPLGRNSGFYVDVFLSDQPDNDYLMHCVGQSLTLCDVKGQPLATRPVDLGVRYARGYDWFEDIKGIDYKKPFKACWQVTDSIHVSLWMIGDNRRRLMTVSAPHTTINRGLTPGNVSTSPQRTPTLLVRQTNLNGCRHPFVSVIEPYVGEPLVCKVDFRKVTATKVRLNVHLKDGRTIPVDMEL